MADTNIIKPLQRFWKLVALEKREIFSIYFYALLSGVIYLSLPLGVQAIINLLFGGLVSTSIVVLISVVVLGVVASGWLQILQMQVNERIQRRIFTRYSLQFAHKIPRLDLIAVDDYYLPELVNRFFDTASLQKGVSKVLLDFPSATVQIVFGIALLSLYNSTFLFFGMGLVLLIYLILRYTYPKGISTSIEESNYKYEVGYWLEEVARTIKTIKFMGMTRYPLKRADVLVSGYLDARAEHFKVLKTQFWAFVLFKTVITAGLLIVGSVLVVNQQINLGQFIAAEIVIITLLNSVEKLIGSLDVVYDMLTSLEKVSKILDKPIEPEEGINITEISNGPGIDIKVQNLNYTYHDDDNHVLHDVSFEIGSGEKVCIFGSLGSGKSTLLKLFTGAYPNYKGKIIYDGYPLGNFNLHTLRNEIGVFLAGADLFSGTLWENLTLGDERISNELIMKVAKDVGLLTFIQNQKYGLNTKVDSLGKNLPRNIMNKILLSRALLTEPRLVLLEDCWSTLEKVEQEHMVNYLTGPECKFTLIAVTNDEEFASKCDKIVLLEDGRVIASGPFSQLKNTPEYKRMFKSLSL